MISSIFRLKGRFAAWPKNSFQFSPTANCFCLSQLMHTLLQEIFTSSFMWIDDYLGWFHYQSPTPASPWPTATALTCHVTGCVITVAFFLSSLDFKFFEDRDYTVVIFLSSVSGIGWIFRCLINTCWMIWHFTSLLPAISRQRDNIRNFWRERFMSQMLLKITGLLYDRCFILPFTFFLHYRTTLLVKIWNRTWLRFPT